MKILILVKLKILILVKLKILVLVKLKIKMKTRIGICSCECLGIRGNGVVKKNGNWKRRQIVWVFWNKGHVSELCEKWIYLDGKYAYARFEEL